MYEKNDPLRDAMAGDRAAAADWFFGTFAVWVLKIAAIGLTAVFTFILIITALPKTASPIMIGFAMVGGFLLEVCFLLSSIWITISKGTKQSVLAWIIFLFSISFLIANVVAGAIVSEDKKATLGNGWIDWYLIVMPATGLICTVFVVLWKLAGPQSNAVKKAHLASGLLEERYQNSKLRAALYDLDLQEAVDVQARSDAWGTVGRSLGLSAYQFKPGHQPPPQQPYYYQPQPGYSYNQPYAYPTPAPMPPEQQQYLVAPNSVPAQPNQPPYQPEQLPAPNTIPFQHQMYAPQMQLQPVANKPQKEPARAVTKIPVRSGGAAPAPSIPPAQPQQSEQRESVGDRTRNFFEGLFSGDQMAQSEVDHEETEATEQPLTQQDAETDLEAETADLNLEPSPVVERPTRSLFGTPEPEENQESEDEEIDPAFLPTHPVKINGVTVNPPVEGD